MNIEELIKEAEKRFRVFYSRFDSRIYTTKKEVEISVNEKFVNVSLLFNKKRYSQCYVIKDGKLIN